MANPVQAAKAGRKPIDPDETPSQRFKRLGESRMEKALSGIRGLGQLASSVYEYTPEQVEKIESTLREEVARACQALRDRKTATSSGFKL